MKTLSTNEMSQVGGGNNPCNVRIDCYYANGADTNVGGIAKDALLADESSKKCPKTYALSAPANYKEVDSHTHPDYLSVTYLANLCAINRA